MADREILLGIDVGTTKVAAVAGERGEEVRLLAAASAPCRGLRRGVVVDLEETTEAVRRAVSEVQRSARVELGSAWVGLTGQHMTCVNSHAEVRLPRANREVTWSDVERVMAAAVSAVSIPPDRRMIHAISRGFMVDDEPRVRNPVGLTASRLAVDTHIVTIPRNTVENVAKAVEQAGLSVAELVAEPLAAADAVLTQEEEDLGVLLVDIGGGTTDIALFSEGSIAFSGAVPVAGNLITHDLAVALGVTHPQAEEIKLAHGCARAAAVPEEEFVSVPSAEGEDTVNRRFLAEVIEARVEEMFRLAAQKLRAGGGPGPPPGGVVLTGGGSLLPEIAKVAEEVFSCRARLGRVAAGALDAARNPAFATGVGLVYYAHREAETRRADRGRQIRVLPILGRVVAWVKELFRS